MEEIYTFDPVLYSKEECKWLLTHIGEPSVLALREIGDSGVNAKAVKPILERVNDLDTTQEHKGGTWVGVEAIKEAIRVYLKEDAKWEFDAKRSKRAPRFPSLYSFDSKGRAHKGGPGSDSGWVRTYFGPSGERLPFAINLVLQDADDWAAPGSEVAQTEKGLRIDPATNRIECLVKVGDGICGHTESYKGESRSSYYAARARMSKHLRKATENVEEHRELHTNEFSS